MAGFFQVFRPDGQRLQPLFDDIPVGRDVFSRLQQVYRATVAGSQGLQGIDAYFMVRNPDPATHNSLLRYATAQLANWRQMAGEINEQELVDLLTPVPRIAISNDVPPEPDPNDIESLDVFIYDVETDWHAQLIPQCPHASWLRQAFYYIACDYGLARYITWPWYRNSSSIKEPFKPYFNLWLHGAKLRCESRDSITLFVAANGNSAEP
jgi:hypothetical protein